MAIHERRSVYARSDRVAPARPLRPLSPVRAIEADAAADGFGVAWARTITWLPLLGTLALGAVYVVRSRSFYWIMLEDHPVEWAQFAFLAFAVLVGPLAAVRFARQRRYGLAGLMVVLAVGCLVLAGEEISWGERAFNLAPPADLASINEQRELNLHNIAVDGVSANVLSELLELVLGLGGAVVALLARPRRGQLRRTWVWDVAPPLVTVPAFLLMALYQAVTMEVADQPAPVSLYQEWAEFGLYLGLAVTAACCWARATPGRQMIDLTGRRPQRRVDRRVRIRRRPLVVAGLLALTLTGTLAQLSARSHVLPGNVPPSLVGLYGSF